MPPHRQGYWKLRKLRTLRLAACALVAAGIAACEAGSDVLVQGLDLFSVRSIRELPADRARRWVEEGGATLVGAGGLAAGEASEAARRGELGAALVVSDEPASDLRIAAELSRAGVARVAVVRGGGPAWAAARSPTLARGPDGG